MIRFRWIFEKNIYYIKCGNLRVVSRFRKEKKIYCTNILFNYYNIHACIHYGSK